VGRAVLLLAIIGLAGCSLTGDDGGASIDVAELEKLVLQPDDLPGSFMRFDEGRQIAADLPPGPRADPARFGRQEGWKARYRRARTVEITGPLVIESKADLFDSSDGAEDDFEAARAETDETEPEWQPIGEPGLGDESFAATLLEGTETSGVRFYQVVWRDDNVTASLNANGFARGLALEDVLELARAQERRIESVAESS
jgi:hypothetical protein